MLQKAQKIKDSARAIKEIQKKSEAMARANAELDNEVTRGLTSYRAGVISLREKQRELREQKIPRVLRERIKAELKNSRKALVEARKLITSPESGKDLESASLAVTQANEKLKLAFGELDRHLKTLKAAGKKAAPPGPQPK